MKKGAQQNNMPESKIFKQKLKGKNQRSKSVQKARISPYQSPKNWQQKQLETQNWEQDKLMILKDQQIKCIQQSQLSRLKCMQHSKKYKGQISLKDKQDINRFQQEIAKQIIKVDKISENDVKAGCVIQPLSSSFEETRENQANISNYVTPSIKKQENKINMDGFKAQKRQSNQPKQEEAAQKLAIKLQEFPMNQDQIRSQTQAFPARSVKTIIHLKNQKDNSSPLNSQQKQQLNFQFKTSQQGNHRNVQQISLKIPQEDNLISQTPFRRESEQTFVTNQIKRKKLNSNKKLSFQLKDKERQKQNFQDSERINTSQNNQHSSRETNSGYKVQIAVPLAHHDC